MTTSAVDGLQAALELEQHAALLIELAIVGLVIITAIDAAIHLIKDLESKDDDPPAY